MSLNKKVKSQLGISVILIIILGISSFIPLLLMGTDDSIIHDITYQIDPYSSNLQAGLNMLTHNTDLISMNNITYYELRMNQTGFTEIRDIISEKLTITNKEVIYKIRIIKTDTRGSEICLNGQFQNVGLKLDLITFLGNVTEIGLCDFEPQNLTDYVNEAKLETARNIGLGFGAVEIIIGIISGIIVKIKSKE